MEPGKGLHDWTIWRDTANHSATERVGDTDARSQSNSALQSLAFPLYCLAPANFKIEQGSDSKKIEALLGGIICIVSCYNDAVVMVRKLWQ